MVTSFMLEGDQQVSDEVRACIVELLAGYCYPSLAGTSTAFATCHSWIA